MENLTTHVENYNSVVDSNIATEADVDIMDFDNDEEFTDFCLNRNPHVMYHPTLNIPYYDYEYTQGYMDAIRDMKRFRINDPNSLINKHQRVNRGVTTKPVQNLIVD